MGVLVPYLYFNVLGSVEKKQKIFMGDSGSLTLGFILGFLFIKFAMDNPNVMPFRKDSLLLSFTMLIVPMIDVVRVVIARTLHRRPLFQADKNHIHHKLMRAGMTQHQALITILLLALAFTTINVTLSHLGYYDITLIVLVDLLVFVLFMTMVNKRIRKNGAQPFV